MTDRESDAETILPALSVGRPSTRWGFLRWSLAILGGLSVIAAALACTAVGIYLNAVRVDAKIAEEALSQARTEGVPMTVGEMEAFYPTSPEIEANTKAWQRAIVELGVIDYGRWEANLPIVLSPGMDPLASLPDRDERGLLQGDDLERTRQFVEPYREAIEAAHAARRTGKVTRYPLDFQAHLFLDIQHLEALRAFPKLLQLNVEVCVVDGEIDEAVECLLTTIGLGESLADEPLTVSQLIRATCWKSAKDQARLVSACASSKKRQLERIQSVFIEPDFESAFKRSNAGERFMFVAAMRGRETVPDDRLTAIRATGFRGRDLAKTLEFFRRSDAAIEQGLIAARIEGEAIEEEVVRLSNDRELRERYRGTILMLPALGATANAYLRATANATLGRTGVACERYRSARGQLPRSLAELVPDFLSERPIDPFDEEPLRYVWREDGATVYSIGQDLVDDLGEVDLETSGSTKGDVLFRLYDRPSDESASP